MLGSKFRASKLALAAVLALGAGVAAQAALLPNWVATHTKAHDVRTAVHLGEMPATADVHIAVSLKLRNKAELDALTAKLMANTPGVHPISHEAYMQRFAPTEAQAQAVADYLRAQGFRHVEIAENRLLVTADGSAASIKNAFKAELHQYSVEGRIAHANVTDAQVPAHLGDTVNAVLGLQTVHMAHVGAKRFDGAQPQASIYAVQGVNPTQFGSIYGGSSLPSASNATIGIITAGSMTQTVSDLRQFAANAGFPSPPVSVVQVGAAGTDTSGTGEWNMDSQSSLATAGGTIKQMLLYTATDLSDSALTADYNKVISDNQAKAINVSLGECENDAQSSGIESSNDQIFQSAVAQGQMFSVSSGDSGSYECGGSSNAQSYPAVSPYVMSIGGTTLSSSGGTWQGETVWSCSGPSDCPQSASGGTGGGPSLTESAPSWQTSAGVLGGSTKRGVPDIAFDAAPSSGALILVNGSNQQIGGTSLAAPIWTGFWARIQSANGNNLPFPAQTLYQGASAHPEWFHDVTSGGNGGYSAKAGWDYTTGYGSLIVSNFASAFSGGGGGGGGGGSSLIGNGDFESGTASPWTMSSGTLCSNSGCSGETAHGGSWFAWLDGYGSAHTDTVSQTVSIPAGAGSASLSFYLHVDTAETTTSSAYDTLKVQVVSGGTTATVATYSNLNKNTGYALKSVNLNAYIGKTVTVQFVGTEDSSLQTSFVIDDVSLAAQ